MTNFNLPYFAKNPSEFWRRWHISLSTWLRDYLYIPLGGSKKSKVTTYRNLAITMLLGGLWHGAAFTFILWGAYHGLLLIIHRSLKTILIKTNKMSNLITGKAHNALKIILFYHLVVLGWLFFRADSVTQAMSMFKSLLFNFRYEHDMNIELNLVMLISFTCIFLIIQTMQYIKDDLMIIYHSNIMNKTIVYTITGLCIIIFGVNENNVFIYFQF